MSKRNSKEIERDAGQEELRRQIRLETERQGQELNRSLRRKIAEFLGFADLMAVLMVAATAFTAFATWRTATIARDLLLTSERPYFGVHGVTLDHSRTDDPRVYVDFRNFGHVPADDVRLMVTTYLGGSTQPANRVARDAGIMSPEVPHHIFVRIPYDRYADVIAGRVKLLTEVAAWYKAAGRSLFCYRERFAYKAGSGTFEIAGGSSRCGSPPPP